MDAISPKSPPIDERMMHSTGNNLAAELQAILDDREREDSAATRIETRGYAEETPDLRQQSYDPSRTNLLKYIPSEAGLRTADSLDVEPVTTTEHAGLQELVQFLEDIADSDTKDAAEAKEILNSLTFIGEVEFQSATAGIAEYWKQYLRKSPDRQILTVAGIESTYQRELMRGKSDTYTLDAIMKHFSGKELSEFAGRITTNPADIKSDPKNTKIAIVDDWALSGRQLLRVQDMLNHDARIVGYEDSIEANILCASPHYLEEGIVDEENGQTLRVKAYYRAKPANTEYGARITGAHSSADFGFEDEITTMVANQIASGHTAVMPPLTNIVRPYRKPQEEPNWAEIDDLPDL